MRCPSSIRNVFLRNLFLLGLCSPRQHRKAFPSFFSAHRLVRYRSIAKHHGAFAVPRFRHLFGNSFPPRFLQAPRFKSGSQISAETSSTALHVFAVPREGTDYRGSERGMRALSCRAKHPEGTVGLLGLLCLLGILLLLVLSSTGKIGK